MEQEAPKFSQKAVRTAEAIVRVFETGTPLGNYCGIAVLRDGAGLSYGISQFTHRSGSLEAVVRDYLANGGAIGRQTLERCLPLLRSRSNAALRTLAANTAFRKALAAAGVTREMREAQDGVAFQRYMLPAVNACLGSGFLRPLSLAVIYDSMTHGSYNRLRDRVRGFDARDFERSWISEYVRLRDGWLASIPRLRATRYRTRFFLNQIALGRWELDLPLRVNGVVITDELLGTRVGHQDAAGQIELENHSANETAVSGPAGRDVLGRIEQRIDGAAESYDRVERMTLKVADRTDRAKSLWTTVVGTIWQTAWAIFGFLGGLPREVWLVVAVIAAVLTIAYLYRQIALGKLRELPNSMIPDTRGDAR